MDKNRNNLHRHPIEKEQILVITIRSHPSSIQPTKTSTVFPESLPINNKESFPCTPTLLASYKSPVSRYSSSRIKSGRYRINLNKLQHPISQLQSESSNDYDETRTTNLLNSPSDTRTPREYDRSFRLNNNSFQRSVHSYSPNGDYTSEVSNNSSSNHDYDSPERSYHYPTYTGSSRGYHSNPSNYDDIDAPQGENVVLPSNNNNGPQVVNPPLSPQDNNHHPVENHSLPEYDNNSPHGSQHSEAPAEEIPLVVEEDINLNRIMQLYDENFPLIHQYRQDLYNFYELKGLLIPPENPDKYARYEVVDGEIHLGQGIFVGETSLKMFRMQGLFKFERKIALAIWGPKERLANRYLLPKGQKVVFAGQGVCSIIKPKCLELYLSLTYDYINEYWKHKTDVEKDELMVDATYRLSIQIRDLRNGFDENGAERKRKSKSK
ncbi:hypothetical protein TKK_0011646 [Trichogramma kaykai]